MFRKNVPTQFVRPYRQRVFGGIRQEKVKGQAFKRVPASVKDRYKEIIPVVAATISIIVGVPVVRELIRSKRG